MLITVELGDQARGHAVPAVQEARVVSDRVGGTPLAVVVDPRDPRRWAVFARVLDDGEVDLRLGREHLVDPASGTRWDPAHGLGVSGPLADQPLAQLPAFTVLPRDFWTFFPDGAIWDG